MLSIATKARPYLGAVIMSTLLLTGGGIYSASRMPSSVYPEVTFPRISLVAKVPDSDVTNMEIKVTRPLEEAVTGVVGFSQVRSKTIRGGSELSIDFTPDTDMVRALQETSQRANAARSDMPANVSITVEQMSPSVFPILSLVLTGGDNPSQLRDYAYYELAPLIKKIPDVKRAEVSGGDLREIEVICRPEDLLAHNLSAADLADQIGQLTPHMPVGRVESQPLAYQILINNQVKTVSEIEQLKISTSTSKTQPVRVKDVADVKILHTDRAQSIGYDRRDAVVITVFRRIGGNTLEISRNLAKLLEEKGLTAPAGDSNKKPPRNIQATVVYDQANFVETAVDNVRDAILIGGLFSVLILLAFLRSWRATLISALAIPTTLAITFLFLHATGETLNLMSLGGLAVAIGLIIDDTVVVVENIARHLTPHGHGAGGAASHAQSPNGETTANALPGAAAGMPAKDPVDAASGEITGAVIGSTLTTVLVFVPLAFIVGVYGQFFKSLSWSLCIAVLVSMVISLTLVPVFAAKFLAGRPMPEPGRVYNFIANIYEVMLDRALRYPWTMLGASLLVSVLGFLVLSFGIPIPNPLAQREPAQPMPPVADPLKTGLMPSMDEGAFVIDYWAPAGSPLVETERKATEIEKILSNHPDVKAYVRRTGAELGLFATQTSRGDIQVVLRPAEQDPISMVTKRVRPKMEDLEKELKKEGKTVAGEKENIRKKYRRRSVKDIMDEVADAAKDAFGEHQLKIDPVQIMEDELNDLSGANKPIEVKIFGKDQEQLRKLAEKVGDVLETKGKSRGFGEINTSVRGGNPDLMLQLDGDNADKLGLKPDAVGRQLKAIFQGQIATQAVESSVRITDVRVRYPDTIRFGTDRTDPKTSYFNRELVLNQMILLPDTRLPATVAAGGPGNVTPSRAVPLHALGDIKAMRTPDEQYRENQQPAIFISAEKKEDASLGAMVSDVRTWMATEKDVQMPPGYHWELGGHYIRQQEAFNSLLVVMVVAILLVYIMLAVQFQSVVLPFLIFLTQPLSIVSGLLALWVTSTPLNVSSYMGVILLIGLDMKNGILLVEYIQQLRKEGMALRPALLLAGRTRFRPILMTSLAAILGLFPLALGIGPGSQMQQPLAIMVIGGLTANMLFTRMVIPVGYLVLEGRKDESKTTPTLTPTPVLAPIVTEPVQSAGIVQEG